MYDLLKLVFHFSPLSVPSQHVMKFAEITQEVTIQRIDGRFQEVPETPNGRLYPNLEEEFRSDTGSGKYELVFHSSPSFNIRFFQVGMG